MSAVKSFLELVEFHERKWGTEDYPGRPALKLLLNLPVVAMWRIGKRFGFSTHTMIDELNDILTGLMTGKLHNPDSRTLYKVFINQQDFEFAIRLVGNGSEERSSVDEQSAEIAHNADGAKKTKPWAYPDEPAIVESNPQRALRDVPPQIPHYIPKIVERGSKPGRNPKMQPGRNPKELPGRKVAIITGIAKHQNGKK